MLGFLEISSISVARLLPTKAEVIFSPPAPEEAPGDSEACWATSARLWGSLHDLARASLLGSLLSASGLRAAWHGAERGRSHPGPCRVTRGVSLLEGPVACE